MGEKCEAKTTNTVLTKNTRLTSETSYVYHQTNKKWLFVYIFDKNVARFARLHLKGVWHVLNHKWLHHYGTHCRSVNCILFWKQRPPCSKQKPKSLRRRSVLCRSFVFSTHRNRQLFGIWYGKWLKTKMKTSEKICFELVKLDMKSRKIISFCFAEETSVNGWKTISPEQPSEFLARFISSNWYSSQIHWNQVCHLID